MALITTKGLNGILAVLEIAKASEVSPISIREISERTGVSKNYLQQVLDPLRQNGVISPKKGKNGGYFLAKNSRDITFLEIFRAAEKDIKTTNLAVENRPLKDIFAKFDQKLEAIYSVSIDEFYAFEKDSRKFLDFVI